MLLSIFFLIQHHSNEPHFIVFFSLTKCASTLKMIELKRNHYNSSYGLKANLLAGCNITGTAVTLTSLYLRENMQQMSSSKKSENQSTSILKDKFHEERLVFSCSV